jgi:threonine/homoserine/homoserine lactone efflux protein
VLNPKIGVFYVAVLPAFLPSAPGPAVVMGAVLALVRVLLSSAWFAS